MSQSSAWKLRVRTTLTYVRRAIDTYVRASKVQQVTTRAVPLDSVKSTTAAIVAGGTEG